MNKIYRLIKSHVSGVVQVVPETARTSGKGKSVVGVCGARKLRKIITGLIASIATKRSSGPGRSRLLAASTITLALAGAPASAIAVDSIFTDTGDGLWGTLANWDNGTPSLVGDIASITGAAVSLGGSNFTVGKLTLNSASITGTGTLTMDNSGSPAIIDANSGSFTGPTLSLAGETQITTGELQVTGGTVTGAGSFTVDSTLTLNTANSFTGGVKVNSGGTLNLGINNAVGTGTVTNGGTLLATTDVTLTNALVLTGSQTFAALTGTTLALNGSFTAISGGTVHFGNSGNDGVVVLVANGGAISSGERIAIDAGTLRVGSSNASIVLSVIDGTTIASGATLDLNGINTTVNKLSSTASDAIVTNNSATTDVTLTTKGTSTFAGQIKDGATNTIALAVATGAVTTLSGANTYTGGTTINSGGALQIGAGGTTGSITGDVTDNGSLIFNRSNALSFGGIISGTGSMTKLGAGTLTLSAANTYTGTTTVSAGTLNVTNGSALGGTAGGTVVENGATLELSGSAGPYVTFTGEALTLNGAGVGGASGALYSASGAYQWTGPITLGSDSTIKSDSSPLLINGTIDNGGHLLTTAGSGYVYLNGDITGSGGLTTNAGLTTLNGTNTYTGTTTVQSGRLEISGGSAIADTGAVVVNNGGTLVVVSSETIGSLAGDAGSTVRGGLPFENATLTTGGNGASTTFAGTIQDDGPDDTMGLTKIGAGTLTLTGVNTYTGGTTINSGGALQIGAGGTTGSITGDVTDNGSLIFNRSNALSFGGIISGSGSLTKLGAGTLTLSGSNTYSGGTTVAGGTLALSNSMAAGTGTITTTGSVISYANGINVANAININSDTTQLEVVGTDAAEQSGVISETAGPRPLEKIGTGTLTLSAANTYTGTTTVSAGTLSLAGGSAIYDTGVVVVNGGGTLNLAASETIGSLAGAGNVTLNANTLTTGGNNTSTTFSGVMSGTGSLAKTGTGNLTLTGANTYTGDTNVNAGVLFVNGSIVGDTFVNAGGTLGGSGSLGNVTVYSGGTLSPGNSPGILTVNGDLTLNSGATTIMQIDGTTLGTEYDHIDVTGTATLDGTLDLQFSYVPTIGSTYNLINAGSFVLVGDPTNGFNPITDNISSNLGAAVKVTPVISATEYDILIEQLSFIVAAGGNLTPNQTRTATGVDSLATSGNGPTLMAALNMLSAGEIPGALDSLSGVQHTHSLQRTAGATRQFTRILGDRLSWADYTTHTASNFDNVKLAYNGENMASLFGAPVKTKPSSNVWLRAMGGFGDLDSDGNATGAEHNNRGAAIGFDRDVREGLMAGVAFGYTRSNVNLNAGLTDVDSYQLAAYGRKQWDNTYIDATVGIGHHRVDSTRQVQFDGFSGVAQADYHINDIGLSLEAGKHYTLSAASQITPFAGLQYGHYRQKGFTETGAGDANLSYGDDNMNSLRSVLGARLAGSLGEGGSASLALSWSHEFLDREASLNPAFAVNGNVPFNVKGPVLDRDHLLATLGVSGRLSKTSQVDLDYNGEFAKSDRQHAITATYRMQW